MSNVSIALAPGDADLEIPEGADEEEVADLKQQMIDDAVDVVAEMQLTSEQLKVGLSALRFMHLQLLALADIIWVLWSSLAVGSVLAHIKICGPYMSCCKPKNAIFIHHLQLDTLHLYKKPLAATCCSRPC